VTTTFMLVRHGTCALMDKILFGRTVDAPLDSFGELQCSALAQRLAGAHEIAIHTSPRRRARQTAAAIAEQARCDFIVRPELDEVDFGAWSGQPFEALEADAGWRAWNEHRGTASTPAGETVSSVRRRIVGHIEHLHARHEGDTMILVSHAEVIRCALMHYLHIPPELYGRLEIGPASVSVLRLDEHSAHLVL
jgi:broad specificity phosphatase PhoE